MWRIQQFDFRYLGRSIIFITGTDCVTGSSTFFSLKIGEKVFGARCSSLASVSLLSISVSIATSVSTSERCNSCYRSSTTRRAHRLRKKKDFENSHSVSKMQISGNRYRKEDSNCDNNRIYFQNYYEELHLLRLYCVSKSCITIILSRESIVRYKIT